ncbi:MAG TPA: iron-containing alcohol dehydrogenase [Candidatus Hydrogenedentes bacterium]|nr:iron-containing alcohol dehydrogenase [Candidatus Hydrogenedentota bacterium]HQH52337.1 iron-containing alcohol dehydrogenase [Candidatus Hydrogenedentota bacterium]HQM49425.1 iron-containing alcohol dehydrogenase [Candidatus Hydrogenedentota bacterium]
MDVVRFNFPTCILFGPGARRKLTGLLRAEGKSRPLFISDRGVAALGFFSELVTDAANAGFDAGTFSEVTANPAASQVAAGAEVCRAHGADAVVLVGGGAALDVGKAVALMAHHPGNVFDYEDGKPDALPVDREMPWIVAIPTTSGTGSEVGRCSVISDDATHIKRIIFSPRLLPSVVLADPELTLELPPALTAATGIDALSHNVEAFLSTGFHPMCDGIALEAIRLIAGNLVACYREPSNIEARANMMAASTMGAVAFQKGLGVVHSCAHALSAVTDMHHGLANGLMMVPAMKFNKAAVPERLARMASAAGTKAVPGAFITWIQRLLKDLDFPEGLSGAGVSKEQIPALVETALQDGCHTSNPRPVGRNDFKALFRAAM